MKKKPSGTNNSKLNMTCRMGFRATQQERITIQAKAQACGKSVSDYIRQCAVGHKPKLRMTRSQAQAYIGISEARGNLIHIKNALNAMSQEDRIRCFADPYFMRRWISSANKLIHRWQEIAQRFSDYGKINETCVGQTAKGTKVIRLIQVKTTQPVVIPIMDNRLEVLLKKYDYNVPDLVDVCVNRAIKRICKRLSKDVPSLAVKERTRLDKKEREQERKAKEKGEELFEYDDKGYVLKPRYSLIKTHTARRTGITLMYLSGNYTMGQMMSVSGHKKESTFREYIKLSADEFADDVASASSDGLF